MVDFSLKMMDFRLKLVDFSFKMLDLGFKTVDFGFKMLDFSFKMVDVGFKVGIHAKLNSAAYVGPCGPWTLRRVHTQAPLRKPRCFHATWPVWALDPSRVHTQAASWGFRRLQTISRGCGGKPFAGKALEPIQGFHLEWNPKP